MGLCSKWESSYSYALQLLASTFLAIIGQIFKGPDCGGYLDITHGELPISQVCNHLTYRTSYALGFYFLFMSAVTKINPTLHHGYFILKNLGLLFLLIVITFINGEILESMVFISAIASGLFLMLEQLVMIDFTLTINDYVRGHSGATVVEMENRSEYPCFWTMVYLVGGLLGFILGILGLKQTYELYGTCPAHMAVITSTAFFGGVVIVVSTCSQFGKGLLSGIGVFCNNIYLCWSALMASNLKGNCSTIDIPKDPKDLAIALILACISLAWTSYRSAKWAVFQGEIHREEFEKNVDILPLDNSISYTDEEEKPEQKWWLYHIVLANGGFYVLLLLTRWEDAGIGAGMWVKMGAQWFSTLLYLWVSCAPKCLPHRDFSV